MPPGVAVPPSDLGVAGPLARSADDLRLELETVGGPGALQAVAYRWTLPAARATRLRDCRLGFVLDDPFCPLTAEVAAVHARALDALRRSGATLHEGWPEGFLPQAAFESYFYLSSLRLAQALSDDQLESLRRQAEHPAGYYAKRRLEALTSSVREWSRHNAARFQARARWAEYFKTHDAFLMPVNFIPAFAHDQSQPMYVRLLDTPEGKRMYLDLMKWVSPATLSGCPATSAPIGTTVGGLPVGLQIMGPYLEDATPIAVARLLAEVVGGFKPPPAFT
jgi:amidase